MASWRIDVFGGFQFLREGRPVALANRKDRLLLGYLALRSGTPVRREHLAGLLWGDRAEEQARTSLRQSLTAIRAAFGAASESPLASDRETVTLCEHSGLMIDARDFQRLRREEGGGLAALRLYRGPVLDGLDTASPEFGQWLMAERTSFEDAAVSLISGLPVEQLSGEEMDIILGRIREVLSRDRLREALYQTAMRILVRQRKVPDAARAYKECCAALQEELGIAPSEATTDLYQQLVMQTPRQQANVVARQPEERPSIAVMPFENLSADQSLAILCEGVAEEIAVGLGAFSFFTVIDRHSAREVSRLTADARERGRRLGVALIIQGSLQRSPNGFHLLVKLIEAETRAQRWATRFHLPEGDLLSAPHRIIKAVLPSINAQVEASLLHRSRRRTTPGAYEHLLLGVRCLRGYLPEDNRNAIRHFDQALERDPDFALARAYRGFAEIVMHDYSACPPEILESSIHMIRKAADLEPEESRIWWLLGLAVSYAGDLATEERCYRRAAELNPNDANNLATLGHVTVARGGKSEGLALFEEAFRLNPYHPEWYWIDYGNALYLCERYAEALEAFRHRREPFVWLLGRIAACYGQLGQTEKARDCVAEILRMNPDFRVSQQRATNWSADDAEKFRHGMLKAGLPP